MIVVGSGEFVYETDQADWGKLPQGYTFTVVAGMAVDSHDKVYVFNRNPNHVFVLDPDGNFLSMWDDNLFADYGIHSPHGFYIGPDEKVYLTDARDHTVRKFTLDGELLLTLGTPGTLGKEGEPFRRPTAAAISSSGDIFVSDGYGNSRVHKYSPEGKLLMSWGSPGSGPGQFNIPHSVWVDREDHVWVADRNNDRIQIFTTEGKYVTQLTDFNKPCTTIIDANDKIYVPELAGRISILNRDGKLLTRWGCEKNYLLEYISKIPGDFIPYRDVMKNCLKTPGKFSAAHSCCIDSKGNLYVGEVESGQRITKFIKKK